MPNEQSLQSQPLRQDTAETRKNTAGNSQQEAMQRLTDADQSTGLHVLLGNMKALASQGSAEKLERRAEQPMLGQGRLTQDFEAMTMFSHPLSAQLETIPDTEVRRL